MTRKGDNQWETREEMEIDRLKTKRDRDGEGNGEGEGKGERQGKGRGEGKGYGGRTTGRGVLSALPVPKGECPID